MQVEFKIKNWGTDVYVHESHRAVPVASFSDEPEAMNELEGRFNKAIEEVKEKYKKAKIVQES